MKGKIWWLIGLGLLVALAIPAVGLGTALAQDPTPTPTPDSTDTWCGGAGGMMGGMGFMHGGLFGANLDRLATTLGITTDELTAQLKEGKTLKQIAEAKGVSESTLVETILAPIRDRMQLMVKNGYITEQQASDHLAAIQQQVETLIGQPLPQGGTHQGNGWHQGMMGGNGMMGGGMMGGYGNQGTTSGLGGMMGGLGRSVQGAFGTARGL